MSLPKVVIAALAVLSACPPGAGAQQGGQQGKPTTATILKLQSGDIACYVDLRDDAGKTHREMAEFEICEQKSLLNKRVNLTYRQQRVQSDECQGDPDCKKTRTVMLVASAKVAAAPAGTSSAPAASAATTHCSSSETVLFSCSTGAKAVSVCAAGGAQGYLQYRFGKLGEAPEMLVPEAKTPPARAVTGENVPFSGGGGQWLRFTRGATSYVVYSGIGNWGPNGQKKIIDGVVVEQNGKRAANVKCAAKPTGALQPDHFEKLGIVPGKQDFDFPTDD
jgi:hypothetical protein